MVQGTVQADGFSDKVRSEAVGIRSRLSAGAPGPRGLPTSLRTRIPSLETTRSVTCTACADSGSLPEGERKALHRQ